MEKAARVFCSHRQVDKPSMKASTRRFRDRGINAWLDKCEIKPGNDPVQAINQGLAECEVGLVFFSSALWPGKCFNAEVSTLTLFQERRPPADPGDAGRPSAAAAAVEEPCTPQRRRFRAFGRRLPGGRVSKPQLGPIVAQPQRLQFTLRLGRDATGSVCVEVLRNGDRAARQEGMILVPALRQSLEEFARGHLKDNTRDAVQRGRDPAILGDELDLTLSPGEVGIALCQAFQAVNTTCTLDLCYESGDTGLLALIFEALRIDGCTSALLPSVGVHRHVAGTPANTGAAVPSPLKILVAVGAPDDGKTQNTVLNRGHELQTILDAVEPRAHRGNAEVRFLKIELPQQIHKALLQDAYHVLHLSGHGGPLEPTEPSR